jgi:hypothetical protein
LRRVLALAASVLLLLLAAAAFGWRYLTREGPEALRRELEARLADALRTEVSVGPVRLSLDRYGLEVVATDLRAYPAPAGDALVAESVEVRLDLWAAVGGTVHLRGLELVRPSVRLLRTAEGVAIDAGAEGAKPGPAPGAAAEPEPWHRALTRRLPYLGVRGARVQIVGAPGARDPVELVDLDGVVARRWLGTGLEVTAEGGLRRGGAAAGRLRIEAEADGTARLRLGFEDVDLALVAALAGADLAAAAPRGRATGSLELGLADGGAPRDFRLEIASPRLRLAPRVGGRSVALDLADAGVALKGTRNRFEGRVRVGALDVPLRARFGRSGLESLRLDSLELAELVPLAQGLPEPERSRVQRALQRAPSGRLADVELRWGPGAAPLQVEGRLERGVLALGATRLEDVAGSARFDGDALEIRDTHARFAGRPLPGLDARISGLARLRSLAELRCVQPAPAPDLPGRRALAEWASGDEPGTGEPSWRSLRLQADWIEHPALGCAVEDLTGSLAPAAGGRGVRVALDRAVWAGVPLRGSIDYQTEPAEHATLRAEVGPPFEPAATELHRAAWAAGRFDVDLTRLGPWRSRGASGRFRARGARLSLDDVRAQFDPGPPLEAAIDLDLDQDGRVPFDFRGEVGPGSVADLFAAAGWSENLTGSLVGSVTLRGALRPGSELLASADGAFSLHMRDGTVRQQARLLLAIAMASETLNPFRERGTIRYAAMDVEGRVANGSYWIDTFAIDGPALRAAANGRIGATGAHETELVMGLFFFRSVDGVIGRVPILNRVMLGKDANLIGAYVALTGPWERVGARVIPTRTLMRGPVGFVFEGLPSFVMGSLRRVQALLPTGEPAPGPEDS